MGPLKRPATLLVIILLMLLAEIGYLLDQTGVLRLSALIPGQIEDGALQCGTVVLSRGVFRRRGVGSLTWVSLQGGDAVLLGDTLMTSSDSRGLLRLDDGNEIELQAETLITLPQRSSKEHVATFLLQLDQGLIRAKRDTETKRLLVQTRKYIIELSKKTETLVYFAPSISGMNVQIIKGDVNLQNREGNETKETAPITLSQGEAISEEFDRAPTKISTNLSLRLVQPQPNERILIPRSSDTISFRWEGTNATAIEIDHSPDFLNPQRTSAKGNEIGIPLFPGKYYWRVRKEETVSGSMPFTVMPAISYEALPGAIGELKWKEIPEAISYQVKLSRTPDFSTTLQQGNFPEAKADFGKLPPGEYFWKIQAEHPLLGLWPASSVFTFKIQDPIVATASPPPLEPAVPKSTSPKVAKPEPKVAKATPVPLNERQLAALTPKLSRVRTLKSTDLPPTDIPNPRPKHTVPVQFQWKELTGHMQYHFEISTHPQFKSNVKQLELSQTQKVIWLSTPADYYWRVAARLQDGTLGPWSSRGEILLEVSGDE